MLIYIHQNNKSQINWRKSISIGGNTMTKATDAKNVKAEEKAPKAPKVEIIRGRMPLPIVFMIKFNTEGETDGAVAAKFRTTNGKVSDIRKSKNFGYITDSYVCNQDRLRRYTP